jgi:hypothetical protein
MTDVFISYARADRNRVRPIALALAAEGFSVWWDPEIKPGAQWNDAIRRALEGAACVLTCWSKKSVKSQWVIAETTHGHGRQALVPVLIQTAAPPIPYNMMQAADLSSWRGDGSDPEWQGVLGQVRRLVEAKRRLATAAPPPGEAYGATRAADATVTAPEEPFAYTKSPQRFSPRLGQMLLGGAVITAVLTVGVFLAPRVMDQVAPGAPAPTTAQAPAPSSPAGTPATPAPDAAAPTEQPTAPPPEPGPIDVSTPVTPTPTGPTPTGPTPTGPTPTGPTPTRPTADLDACVNRLVALCPAADGAAVVGFRADGRLSSPETQFLNTLQIAATPPTAEAVAACQSVVQRRASGAAPSNRRTLFDQACNAVGPAPTGATPTTQTPTTAPADGQPSIGTAIIDALPQILGQGRDTTAPRTGSATIPMGSLLDLGSGRVGSAGELGVTTDYRRVAAASAPLLGVSDGAGIAAMGETSPTQTACARASYGSAPLPVASGDAFCIRRANGTYAAVTVAGQPNANGVTVRYQVWN